MTNKSFLMDALDPVLPQAWIGHVTVQPNWVVVADERDAAALREGFRDLLARSPRMFLGPQGFDLDFSDSDILTKYLRRVTLRAERRPLGVPRIVVDEVAGWASAPRAKSSK